LLLIVDLAPHGALLITLYGLFIWGLIREIEAGCINGISPRGNGKEEREEKQLQTEISFLFKITWEGGGEFIS
jgi:hypothetical protein